MVKAVRTAGWEQLICDLGEGVKVTNYEATMSELVDGWFSGEDDVLISDFVAVCSVQFVVAEHHVFLGGFGDAEVA